MKKPTRAQNKKVVSDFPMALFEETDRAALEMNLSRSGVIRWAVEHALKERRRKRLLADIDEYFSTHGEQQRSIMEHFKHVDSEAF